MENLSENSETALILGAPLPASCIKWTRLIDSILGYNLGHHYMQGKGRTRFESQEE